MKKLLISTCIVFIALALFSSTAFSWGPATHAYIGKKLGYQFGYLNLQEIYGAMAPDIPWIMDPADMNISIALGTLTHYNFQNVEERAWWRSQRAFAYGFATHNEVWGADHTAHWDAQSIPGPGGYVSMQIIPFRASLPTFPVNIPEILDDLEGAGFPVNDLLHKAIEGAIDLLLVTDEPALAKDIGMRMVLSAWLRSPSVPWLLVKAYAGPLLAENPELGSWWQAAKKIIAAEKEFRQLIVLYGLALSQEDPVAAVAEIVATQFGYLIDPTVITPEQLESLTYQVLNAAIIRCTPTYSNELDETIEAISSELD
jgi:hypothetical protein